MNDLRFAVRQLLKALGFTAVAVTTLALGIGACAAIFSVVNSVLLQPLPFPEPDWLMVIKETFPPTLPESTVASGRYLAWRDEATTLESVGALSGMSYNLTGAGQPEHLYAARVTPSLLTLLAVRPALGRCFLRNPVTFVGIVVLLAASAAAACFLPAVRAARLSPMTVLRSD
jgi:putative ABC transport system permease protein